MPSRKSQKKQRGGMFEFLMGSKPTCPENQGQPEEKSYLVQATERLKSVTNLGGDQKPPVGDQKPPVGGRRSRRRRYRRIKSRIRKRR